MCQHQATDSGLLFFDNFAPTKNSFFEVSDNLIACDLWFEPPQSKILATPKPLSHLAKPYLPQRPIFDLRHMPGSGGSNGFVSTSGANFYHLWHVIQPPPGFTPLSYPAYDELFLLRPEFKKFNGSDGVEYSTSEYECRKKLRVRVGVLILKNVLEYEYRNCNFCNCNYILFTKLPWPGDSEGTFRSSSQAATCPPVYHTRRRLYTVPFNAERQAGKL